MAEYIDNAVQGRQGFTKELDSKSTAILLDLTQENQYQYPVESTIRELVSNAVDSTTEKFNALSILSGEKQVSDYYIELEGDVYHASKFQPEYYNPTHLSSSSTVHIQFEQRGVDYQRDMLRVWDEGVGLWGDRLLGYTKVAYSTKRLNANSLGKFGLGAKAPLSMDVASFRIITTHNGRRTALDIYNRKVEQVYGKWADDGSLRKSFVLRKESSYITEGGEEVINPGISLYYDEVDAPNGVMVEVEVKKAERQKLVQAVKSQLLFFTTVHFEVKQEWQDNYVKQEFLANILYEDEYLILSDNNQYSQPHLVLDNGNTKVCYGKIDWDRLELENKNGNIGLKIRSEEVDIVPSREYVKWGTKTRETVLDRFKRAKEVASELVAKELQETDPLLWIKKAAAVQHNLGGTNSILARLSRIVDKDGITPTYPNSDILFASPEELFSNMRLRKITETYRYSNGHTTVDVSREDTYSWNMVNWDAFYFTKGNANKTKDVQLYRLHEKSFSLLTVPTKPVLDLVNIPQWVDRRPEAKLSVDEQLQQSFKQEGFKYFHQLRRLVWLRQSSLLKNYDAVEIDTTLEEELAKVEVVSIQEAAEKGIELTAAEKRKLEGKVFMKAICATGYDGSYYNQEPMLKEVLDWKMPIVYGLQEDKEQLFFLARMLRPSFGFTGNYENAVFTSDKLKLLQVSQQVLKKLPAQAIPVNSFFYETSSTTISLNPMLRVWYTNIQVEAFLKTVPFLNNFQLFNAPMVTLYKELQKYVSDNRVTANFSGEQGKLYTELLEASNKMAIFEQYSKDHNTDAEAIAAKSQELFGINTITGSQVWDIPIQQKMEILQLYCQPLVPFFNQISCLISQYNSAILPEVEQEIRDILTTKGVQTV